MTTINGKYHVTDEYFENSGGGCYLSVITVYDAQANTTRYVLTNDEGSSLVTVDYAFQEIEYDDSMTLANCNMSGQIVYNGASPRLIDYDLEELFSYCQLHYIKCHCKKFKTNWRCCVEELPSELKKLMPAGYEDWLIEHGQKVETDGEKIIVDDDFATETAEDLQYTKDLKELSDYMDEQMILSNDSQEATDKFYAMKATISFGGKVAVLDNSAAVFMALQDAIKYIIEQE